MILNTRQEKNLAIRNKERFSHNKKAETLSFKSLSSTMGSAVNGFFSMIQTHEIAGPTVVNITSMVVPRSAVDFTRSNEAGFETARRETTSLVSSSLLPGFYALGAGAALGFFNNPYGVKSTLMTNNDMVDVLKQNWDNAGKICKNKSSQEITKEYINKTLRETKALVGKDWKPFSKKDRDYISVRLRNIILNNEISRAEAKMQMRNLVKEMVNITGAEQKIRVIGSKTVETSLKNLFDDLYNMPREIFLKYHKENPSTVQNIIKKFKTLNNCKGTIGFSFAALIAVSTQFINRYITQMKTGTSAFVGLPDYEKFAKHEIKEKEEKPSGWKLALAKAGSVATMAYMLGATYAGKLNPLKIVEFASNPSNLLNKLKFTGKFVTLNQLRALSAITISGRILASTDKNELRETNTRDFLGFLNWLVFGGFVAKLAGNALGGEQVLNQEKKLTQPAGWWKRQLHIIKYTFLKTDGEINAMKNISDKAKSVLKRNKNFGIAAGLLYSIAFLGLGIPLINKYITNKNATNPKETNDLEKNYRNIKSEIFNKNLLLIEETLGSLNSATNVSSDFFNLPPENTIFNKFLNKKYR